MDKHQYGTETHREQPAFRLTVRVRKEVFYVCALCAVTFVSVSVWAVL